MFIQNKTEKKNYTHGKEKLNFRKINITNQNDLNLYFKITKITV
jgi:hypothetical protein